MTRKGPGQKWMLQLTHLLFSGAEFDVALPLFARAELGRMLYLTDHQLALCKATASCDSLLTVDQSRYSICNACFLPSLTFGNSDIEMRARQRTDDEMFECLRLESGMGFLAQSQFGTNVLSRSREPEPRTFFLFCAMTKVGGSLIYAVVYWTVIEVSDIFIS